MEALVCYKICSQQALMIQTKLESTVLKELKGDLRFFV